MTNSSPQGRAAARTSNTDWPALAAAVAGGQRSRVDDAVQGASRIEAAEVRRALAVTELRFDAALRQIKRMRHVNLLRKREGRY